MGNQIYHLRDFQSHACNSITCYVGWCAALSFLHSNSCLFTWVSLFPHPAHPHATLVAVYLALFKWSSGPTKRLMEFLTNKLTERKNKDREGKKKSDIAKDRLRSQTYTDVHERSRTFTNIHKRSRTFTNIHNRSRTFTNVHKHSQTFTNVNERLRTFTNVYKCLQTFTYVYKCS